MRCINRDVEYSSSATLCRTGLRINLAIVGLMLLLAARVCHKRIWRLFYCAYAKLSETLKG